MNAILIAYSFTRDLTEYDEFFAKVHELAFNKEYKPFYGCILAPCSYTPYGYRKRLLPFLATADELIVTAINESSCAGKLNGASRDWVMENVMRCAIPKEKSTAEREQ